MTHAREGVKEEFRGRTGHLPPPNDQVDGGLHAVRDAEGGQAEDRRQPTNGQAPLALFGNEKDEASLGTYLKHILYVYGATYLQLKTTTTKMNSEILGPSHFSEILKSKHVIRCPA